MPLTPGHRRSSGGVAELRDGTRIELRPIRPEDREDLAAGVRRMSPESRYRRFLAPTDELSDAELDYLTQVDHHDHEAIVALEPDTGEGLGVARFVRWPNDPEVAEFAIAVADDWHGRGVGTALLKELTERAREEGVRRFSALVLSDNRQMLDMIAELGALQVKDHQAGTVELEVELPPAGPVPALLRTLNAAARGELRVRPRR
jgi:RimJ/RimL family protein N-acetyltransferase